MPLAITLLVMLAAACGVCSAVPQGQTYEWYASQYGERTAAVIMALHADDAYHSWWFLALSGYHPDSGKPDYPGAVLEQG